MLGGHGFNDPMLRIARVLIGSSFSEEVRLPLRLAFAGHHQWNRAPDLLLGRQWE
jgi:hypothetical protein